MYFNFANKGLICAIALSAFLFVLTANELNLSYIKTVNPDNKQINMVSTVGGFTVWSIDNPWYLPQVKNVLNGDGYTLDPRDPELKVRRTPGYPAFYGLHYVLFGESNSFFFIRYTQIFIHLLAVLLLGQAVFNFTSNRSWAILSAFLYGLNPYTAAYLYTTITEGISPAMLVFVLFAYSLCFKSPGLKNYLVLGIVTGSSLLVRPSLIVVIPSIALAIMIQQSAGQETFARVIMGNLRKLAFVVLGTGIILAPWAIRNYYATDGDLVLLEKYYDDDPMNFGRGHSSFRDWISCWDNPANTSAEVYGIQIRTNLQENKPIEDITEAFLQKVPPLVYSINSRESVREAFDDLNDCFREKQATSKNNPNLTRKEERELSLCEDRIVGKFNNLIAEYRAKGSLRYYVLTPLMFMKALIFQSNSYAFGMFSAPQGLPLKTWQIIGKSLMYLLNVLLFASLIPFFLMDRKSFWELKIFIFGSILTTVWLCVIYFRYAEARYFIPCVPPLCVSLAYLLNRFVIGKIWSIDSTHTEKS